MVRLFTKDGQRMEGTSFSPEGAPNEFLFFQGVIRAFVEKALHFTALTAEDGGVQTGAQVVFVDTDRRFFNVDGPGVEERADHFAEVASAAFFFFNPDSHSPVSRRFNASFPGRPFLSQR